MHLPDGFLAAKIWIPMMGISAGTITAVVMIANRRLTEKHIPVLGVLSAFVFAAQMLNFPVAGGTSGHFMGAALLAILVGPWAAVLIMTTILSVQCFVFQDGGLTALGANIFNMGVVAGFIGYYFFYAIRNLIGDKKGFFVGAGIGAWFSIISASACCAFELALSGTVPLKVTLIAMVGTHTIIGVVEGLITCAALSFIMKVRPDLLEIQKI
ncbi:MAG TPA: energy-coupling factor ABC transporter permease [Candidatus Brocadiia bacterium]|nr:energy-coupling factor ABC transporter permease [Planctomycetota bacterium]MDO8092645.1 energy-coupling factor ABC transporter permease [Candidatus Brocadiales bacterium]